MTSKFTQRGKKDEDVTFERNNAFSVPAVLYPLLETVHMRLFRGGAERGQKETASCPLPGDVVITGGENGKVSGLETDTPKMMYETME